MYNEEMRDVLLQIKEEISANQSDLLEGGLLTVTNDQLANEYRFTRGYLEGLKFLEKILLDDEEKESDREDNN